MPIDFGGGSSGGGSSVEYIPPTAPPPSGGGPFINWHSLGSVLSAPTRGALAASKDLGELTVEAGKGLAGTAGAVIREGRTAAGEGVKQTANLAHGRIGQFFDEGNPFGTGGGAVPDITDPASVEAYAKGHPFTGGLIGSNIRTAQDVEQVARAGGNALLPGQPLGSNVGQLGSGPGLLGHTALGAAAARGGGGVLPKLIEDAANVSVLTGPVSEALDASAEGAAATASEHAAALAEAQKTAQAAAKESAQVVTDADAKVAAANTALEQARQAAASGDPAAAAQVVTSSQEASAAAESARQAREYAAQVQAQHEEGFVPLQQAADEAQARADAMQGHADTAKLVHHLGLKTANSPFAAGRLALDKVLKPILGSDLAQHALEPVLGRAADMAAKLKEHVPEGMTPEGRADKAFVRNTLEAGRLSKADETATLRRGYEETAKPTNVEGEAKRSLLHPLGGGRKPMIADPDAQAVAMMSQTGESAQLRQLLVGGNVTREQAIDVFDKALTRNGEHQYTPEQLKLAAEVYGPGVASERALQIRQAIPEIRARFAEGVAPQEAANYERMRGETEPIIQRRTPVTEGTYAQAQHNLYGTEANVEHLKQWHKVLATYERDIAKGGKENVRAGKLLTQATERLEGMHVSEDERANPRKLLNRVLSPARDVARETLNSHRVVDLTAEHVEPAVRKIAQKLIDGKIQPAEAERDLTAQIVKYAARPAASISDEMRMMIGEAAQRGMGPVPRGIPNIASAVRPSELIGGGRERLRAGTAEYNRAVREIAQGGDRQGRGLAKIAEPNRPATAGQVGATKRLLAATNKLRDLQEKVAAQPDIASGLEGVTEKETRTAILEIREAARVWHREQAKAISDELNEAGVKGIDPTPPAKPRPGYAKNRGGNARAGQRIVSNVPDWDNGGWSFASHVFRELDPKFKAWAAKNGYFQLHGADGLGGGLSPEEAVEQWGSHAHGKNEDPARAMEQWLSKVEDAYNHSRAAIPAAAKEAGSDDAIEAALERTGWSAGGDDPLIRELAEAVGSGTLEEAMPHVAEVLHRMDAHNAAVMGPGARLDPGGDVRTALEADRQAEQERGIHGAQQAGRASLDAEGQKLYDRQVAEDQLGIQGQHVVPAREAQLGRASERASQPGRNQGRAEGALISRGGEQIRQGEAMATRGDTAMRQGAAVLGKTTEQSAETVARAAGPIGELYGRVGGAQADVLRAARVYERTQKAIERIEGRKDDAYEKLMASVEAQPRPMRPVLEAGRRINEVLQPMADAADRDYGDGAGDVYRAAAAEATVTADQLRKAGIDPQYIIGNREGEVPAGGGQGRPGEYLPTARATGQRKAGRGLFHPTEFSELYKRSSARLGQEIDNEVAQHIIDGVGGRLADQLASRRPDLTPQQIHEMSGPELVKTMRDAGLSAWDTSDALGRPLRNAQITPDTMVVPTHVWRSYAPYANEILKGGKILGTYDTLLRHWKAATLYLTGRWHTSLILGHAVMAMAGGGIDPVSYFGDVQNAIRLERARLGIASDEDRAYLAQHLTAKQQQGLASAGGFTPGSVVDRGYAQTEFGAGHLRPGQNPIAHPIEAGWRLQSHLDNVNRTAVWLAKLDKGLDKRGLADFRKAYPDMASLSDAEIKNEAAIRLSIRTIGDYKNMSAYEQNVVKRIIPFYPWMRHITKLAFNLVAHDPVRVAWMLHLPLMFSPQSSQVDWLGSSYDIGKDRWLTPPNWNPFDSLERTSDLGNPFSSVSPLISVPTGALTGYDLQNMKTISRAPGTPEGGLHDFGQLGYYAGSEVSPVRALREALPALIGKGQPIARYQTGQPVISGGLTIPADQQMIPGTNRVLSNGLGPLTPLIGLGRQERISEADVLAAQQKKDDAARRAAARYAQQRAAAR